MNLTVPSLSEEEDPDASYARVSEADLPRKKISLAGMEGLRAISSKMGSPVQSELWVRFRE